MMSQLRLIFTLVSVLAITSWMTYGFHFNAPLQRSILQKSHSSEYRHNVNSNAGVSSAVYAMQQKKTRTSLQMNFFSDAARFLTNLNKEASAKHILMTGPEASRKLTILKEELRDSKDISAAFSELAAKVRKKCFSLKEKTSIDMTIIECFTGERMPFC